MIFRLIAPDWLKQERLDLKPVIEGEFTDAELDDYNQMGYNIYYLPNYPSVIITGSSVRGSDIDTFRFIFVDFDLKDSPGTDKQTFVDTILGDKFTPTFIVDSGRGIHVYWQVTDLDAMSYLKFQRRLIRKYNTDEAVGQIFQLMRVPGTLNTKDKGNFKECKYLFESESVYTSEEVDKMLPLITKADEEYCKQHYNKTYNKESDIKVDEKIPLKFAKLIHENAEVKAIWSGGLDDRSKGDYRLGHLMFANGFTKQEAMSVLINSAKALSRAPIHRISYAENIVDKIWTYELEPTNRDFIMLSQSVGEILKTAGEAIKGTRFPCYRYIDATEHGFRLGQVIGLVAGSGVGKTAIALNMFMGFVESNPDFDHFFIPLEQPANEIADRWKTMCQGRTELYDKVHILSNYDENGQFRALTFSDIKAYLLKFKEVTGKKIGCVVIDHIGALNKKGKNGENQDLMDVCHRMKAFAVETNTLLVMQSQAPREKAGSGDIELNKDAAYGTVYFESYCDYLITVWQPLKRCYSEPACPKITAFKFCKIRHKKAGIDAINEDVCYKLVFDVKTEKLRELNETEEKSFTFFLNKATNLRKMDRKTEIGSYQSVSWTKGEGKLNGAATNNQDVSTTQGTGTVH